ncbi:hypothetical protein D3C78_1382310 [compost metagenome]
MTRCIQEYTSESENRSVKVRIHLLTDDEGYDCYLLSVWVWIDGVAQIAAGNTVFRELNDAIEEAKSWL